MLERIHKITSVGLFSDVRPVTISIKKTSLIYGDNGRGKSTLASIMRSYTNSAPDIILNRKTFNSNLAQEVDLQFSHGNRAKFENNLWDRKFSDFHVFDLDFVDTNVYSGGEINPAHRQQLLSFALGQSAVTAKAEFDTANREAAEYGKLKRLAEANLVGYRGQMRLAAYIKLSEVDNIDELIASNIAEQGKFQRVELIKAKSKLKKLTDLSINIDEFFKVMDKTVEQIDENAVSVVNAHFQRISIDKSEKWISEGQLFLKDETCPFCAQDVEGLDLINAYKSYFNTEYSNFIKEIATLENKKNAILLKINIPVITQEYINIADAITSWNEYLNISIASPDFEKIAEVKASLEQNLVECVRIKTASPLEKLDESYKGRCLELIEEIVNYINEFNSQVDLLNNKIDECKVNLENINIQSITEAHNELIFKKNRHTKVVQDLIEDYTTAKANETASAIIKQAKKDALDAIMQATLGRYEASINALLVKFGANFRIEEISYNYLGTGEPRTEYVLRLRGNDITLQGENAGFKTCLSEGDKRTLAFAFFLSVISGDENLGDKIVLIDDPMCSFDSHRKQQTIIELKNINDRCKQLIILAHDAFFIKNIRDEFLKRNNDPSSMSLIKVIHTHGQFSNLAALNLDIECESPYYKNHRLVSGYLDGEQFNEKDVAIAIRPLLEGYLHRRFPGHISSGKLFGEIVQLISAAPVSSPLHNAISITTELNEINSYAGKFHHDTNPNAANEPVFPGELSAFCRRALDIVYRGSI
ncbi:AAA family ATPase [Lelliottia amnigena]|uniref:AAA family ATPase n=1 Tax=Lelliottia amnigena TaxID=61646 RepID=UPI0021D97373|nr:AAA family ATPase [Lelliottia amnigena]MCU7782239.1 AAA family ATPase [Lelliottia amnigena]